MTDRAQIDVDRLELAAQILFSHLRQQQGKELSLDHDYYWSVPATQAYDVYEKPELTIGQLSESVEWLESLIEDPDSALSYHLVWLGDVLRAIGHTYVK